MLAKKQRQDNFWKTVVKKIELNVLEESKKERIKNYDFYPTLPKKLQQRVSRIIPWDYSDEIIDKNYQPKDQSELKNVVERMSKVSQKHSVNFNESTCSLIERREEEFPKFDLNPTNIIHRTLKLKNKPNWLSTFICAPRNERVKWNSKIYPMEKNVSEKPLDEQAEQLIDASADRFAKWMNNIGSKNNKPMTKESIKALFSIGCNSLLLSSIETDPKEVKAIGKAVAEKWNKPEMAIELKYKNYIKSRINTAPKKTKTVAFGTTISYKDRPWVLHKQKISFATVFPEELRTGENLFTGIGHLRSAKAFYKHCEANPHLPRPKYLVKKGYFQVAEQKAADADPPLYELLKVK